MPDEGKKAVPPCRTARIRNEQALLFRLVDLAELLEEFFELIDHLGTQRSIVLADKRRVMRLGGIVRLGEKVVADSHGLLHHLENLRLFRRLETNCHIAVENHLFQTIVDLLFRYLKFAILSCI